jgi:hypothetical protein
MKRHLYALIAMAGMTAIIVAAMVTGAIAQTMGEYGAATASAGASTEATSQGPLDSQIPETVWAGATQFPEGNQLSGASSFPDTDRFSSTSSGDSESSDRFSSADQFPQASALDSTQDRFDTTDRWSQDSWGK